LVNLQEEKERAAREKKELARKEEKERATEKSKRLSISAEEKGVEVSEMARILTKMEQEISVLEVQIEVEEQAHEKAKMQVRLCLCGRGFFCFSLSGGSFRMQPASHLA